VFILAGRGTGERHMISAKAADVSIIRLLLANRQQESLTVYTDGFRAYKPLGRTTHSPVNTSSMATASTLMKAFTWTPASATDRWCDFGSLSNGVSPSDKLTPYIRAFHLRRRVYRKPGEEALKTILEAVLW